MNLASPPADPQGTSTKPYLIRALHEWCTDNGLTPYLAVFVDSNVRVPPSYVKNNEIVLNVGFEATSGLTLGNDFIEFKARFGGVAREIKVPIDHVLAIYARENGQGMAFAPPAGASYTSAAAETPLADAATPAAVEPPPPRRASGLRLASSDSASSRLAPPSSQRSAGDEPPPDPPGGPPRKPVLKRVK